MKREYLRSHFSRDLPVGQFLVLEGPRAGVIGVKPPTGSGWIAKGRSPGKQSRRDQQSNEQV